MHPSVTVVSIGSPDFTPDTAVVLELPEDIQGVGEQILEIRR